MHLPLSHIRPKPTAVLLCFVLLFLAGTVGAQDTRLSPDERGKLDGEFQLLLDRERQEKREGGEAVEIVRPSVASAAVQRGGRTFYSAIVHVDDPAVLDRTGVDLNSVFDGFATVRVTTGQLRALARVPAVSRIEASSQLEPHNDEAAREVGARILNEGSVNGTEYKGQNVIVCMIDTGIDYDHGDFSKSNGDTRILSIWDQPDDNDSTGTGHPTGFSYGAEYTASEIDNDNVSQLDTQGHGTHVAGTAASSGNELVLDGTQSVSEHRGMAPKADVVMVKTTFGEGAVIDAMTYCDDVASTEGKPVVINMSLGHHAAPHDGTGTVAQAVDNVTGPGTIAVISAGNEGNQPIHVSNTVADGATVTEPWTVGSYNANSGAGNDEFRTAAWIDGPNDLEITVTSPNGESDTLSATGTGTTTSDSDTPDGAIYLESGISGNSDRYFLVRVFDNTESRPPAEGTWDIDVTNNGSSPTTYHGWTFTQTVPGAFDNGNGQYSVAIPGTAASAVTVGSYVHRWRWADADENSYPYDGSSDGRDGISAFSSRGPLRDDSQKPDIAAPGQGVISAFSQDASPESWQVVTGEKHFMNQGTSMSAPVVAGSVALLLQEDGSLTPSEVQSYLKNNATVDDFVTGDGSPPNTTFGAGKLDVLGAMVDLLGGSDQREVLSYEDPWTMNGDFGSQTVGGSGSDRIAVRFTPNTDGFVTGVLFHPGAAPAHNLTSPLNVEVWEDDGSGNPDSKHGNTVQVDTSQLKDFSPTAVNLTPASADVMAGTDYHLVFYPDDPSEEIDFAYETAGSNAGRSQTLSGTSWDGLGNDFIIRPEVSRVGGVSTTLPVEIAAFSGTTNGSEATLVWATASETNNAGFRLQHQSPADSTFRRVAFVDGAGTTSDSRSYRHTLEDLVPGRHTFRLEQVDVDGTVNVGPTTTVSVGMQTAYAVTAVSPNPVKTTGTVSVTVREAQEVEAAVYNVLGQRVALLHEGRLAAEDPTTLSVGSRLPSGVYFLRVEGASFTATEKFVRVR